MQCLANILGAPVPFARALEKIASGFPADEQCEAVAKLLQCPILSAKEFCYQDEQNSRIQLALEACWHCSGFISQTAGSSQEPCNDLGRELPEPSQGPDLGSLRLGRSQGPCDDPGSSRLGRSQGPCDALAPESLTGTLRYNQWTKAGNPPRPPPRPPAAAQRTLLLWKFQGVSDSCLRALRSLWDPRCLCIDRTNHSFRYVMGRSWQKTQLMYYYYLKERETKRPRDQESEQKRERGHKMRKRRLESRCWREDDDEDDDVVERGIARKKKEEECNGGASGEERQDYDHLPLRMATTTMAAAVASGEIRTHVHAPFELKPRVVYMYLVSSDNQI
ncbi:hypothetical protein BDZ88DRAFT_490283 [Geranomyces variabilis]|nr:hypothetical protein BDZ88DRAFT_490283 [Geranomyces variabilis]